MARADTDTDTRDKPDVPPFRYSAALAQDIEQRWQEHWDEQHSFYAPNPAGPLAGPTPAGAD